MSLPHLGAFIGTTVFLVRGPMQTSQPDGLLVFSLQLLLVLFWGGRCFCRMLAVHGRLVRIQFTEEYLCGHFCDVSGKNNSTKRLPRTPGALPNGSTKAYTQVLKFRFRVLDQRIQRNESHPGPQHLYQWQHAPYLLLPRTCNPKNPKPSSEQMPLVSSGTGSG